MDGAAGDNGNAQSYKHYQLHLHELHLRYRSKSYSGRPSRSAQAVATAELGVLVPGTVQQRVTCELDFGRDALCTASSPPSTPAGAISRLTALTGADGRVSAADRARNFGRYCYRLHFTSTDTLSIFYSVAGRSGVIRPRASSAATAISENDGGRAPWLSRRH